MSQRDPAPTGCPAGLAVVGPAWCRAPSESITTMTTHTLNDLQTILLSAASQQEAGSLIPLPSAAAGDLARTGKAIAALVRKGLAEEAPVTDRRLAWRDTDQEPTGVFITAAGHEAIGLGAADAHADTAAGAENGGVESGPAEPTDASTPKPATSAGQLRAGSKTAQVLDLLGRPAGATLDELVAATGWLPHTTRAALTGLRKKGHAVTRGKRDDVTCYSIEAAA